MAVLLAAAAAGADVATSLETPLLVYQTIPAIAHDTPSIFAAVIVSPKNTVPLVTIRTVFR
jgi:hypothetical protein